MSDSETGELNGYPRVFLSVDDGVEVTHARTPCNALQTSSVIGTDCACMRMGESLLDSSRMTRNASVFSFSPEPNSADLARSVEPARMWSVYSVMAFKRL